MALLVMSYDRSLLKDHLPHSVKGHRPSATQTSETESHGTPARAITGISGIRSHKGQDQNWPRLPQGQITAESSHWMRTLCEGRSRETKQFPCLRLHCRAKEGFPLPGPFSAGHSAKRKGFFVDKQLTNSGKFTRVNQPDQINDPQASAD